MKKAVKRVVASKTSSAASVKALKKDFKDKLAELSKQFAKQLAEIKKTAQDKAVKEVHDTYAKHEKAKNKAVKEALAGVTKAGVSKTKLTVKKPTKVIQKVKPQKVTAKRAPAIKKTK